MFKILGKIVIPHIYRYEFSPTSKNMFKSLGKTCYTSLNIETGMSEQILKTKVRLFRDSILNLPACLWQINDSQIYM